MSCTLALIESSPKKRKCPPALRLPTTAAVHVQFPCLRAPLSELTPSLFISSYSAATHNEALKARGITDVLNLVGAHKCPNLFPAEFNYCSLAMPDSGKVSIIHYLSSALEFIENAINSGGKVLVHCAMGKSRAPTIACGYLMWKLRLSAEEALQWVMGKHHATDPNLGFLAQLRALEEDCEVQMAGALVSLY